MSRKAHCSACTMIANGVKSRIPLLHTCGLEPAVTEIPQMEYRGPNSHCKACEDEAAGIKTSGGKHTCRKNKNK